MQIPFLVDMNGFTPGSDQQSDTRESIRASSLSTPLNQDMFECQTKSFPSSYKAVKIYINKNRVLGSHPCDVSLA